MIAAALPRSQFQNGDGKTNSKEHLDIDWTWNGECLSFMINDDDERGL